MPFVEQARTPSSARTRVRAVPRKRLDPFALLLGLVMIGLGVLVVVRPASAAPSARASQPASASYVAGR
jgi:hypothetical protein